MMKILISIKTLNIEETGKSLIAFLNNLDYNKYEVDLMVLDAGPLLRDLPKGVNVLYYQDYLLMPNNFIYDVKKYMNVQSLYDSDRFALKNKYDIAIAYDGDDNYADMIAASIHADKKIIWVHNDYKEILKFHHNSIIYKCLYNKMAQKYAYFDEIVCTSKELLTNFNYLFPQYKNKSIYIYDQLFIDNIVKLSKQDTNIKMDKGFNIVTICSFDKKNNIDKLLNLQKELIDSGKHTKLFIIGTGKCFDKIMNQIYDLGLADSVILLDEQINPYNLIKKSDLIVDLSCYHTFNLNVLSGLVLDVPFLSLSNSGIKDIYKYIMPQNGGIISDENNLYDNIIKIMKDWKKHIPFNYSKYSDEINKKISELLNK